MRQSQALAEKETPIMDAGFSGSQPAVLTICLFPLLHHSATPALARHASNHVHDISPSCQVPSYPSCQHPSILATALVSARQGSLLSLSSLAAPCCANGGLAGKHAPAQRRNRGRPHAARRRLAARAPSAVPPQLDSAIEAAPPCAISPSGLGRHERLVRGRRGQLHALCRARWCVLDRSDYHGPEFTPTRPRARRGDLHCLRRQAILRSLPRSAPFVEPLWSRTALLAFGARLGFVSTIPVTDFVPLELHPRSRPPGLVPCSSTAALPSGSPQVFTGSLPSALDHVPGQTLDAPLPQCFSPHPCSSGDPGSDASQNKNNPVWLLVLAPALMSRPRLPLSRALQADP